ncbi:hypothetical protein ElyMa_001424900 [Elysia marginata]|uniref:Potassium channel voltage dependent KCNQ C-terminal domain-containing protein n=1 Tax=Elysia marginata TaxID=1093978 RepID=A0AAV4IVK9_9GAST|nr:hypothetical protein ElyMa_001424900 [Elysia marginata]
MSPARPHSQAGDNHHVRADCQTFLVLTLRGTHAGTGGDRAGLRPCNITIHGTNGVVEDVPRSPRDSEGALKFVVAVLLVYSLLGTVGTMVLRFRTSATKAHRDESIEEAEKYLKHRDKISADYYKARLLKETKKVLNHIKALEGQRNDVTPLAPCLPNESERRTQVFLLSSESPSSRGSSTFTSNEQQGLCELNSSAEESSLLEETENLQQPSPPVHVHLDSVCLDLDLVAQQNGLLVPVT